MHNPYTPPTANLDLINPSSPPTNEPLQYAGFWRRFGSYWIDFAILTPVVGITYFLGEQVRLFYLYWLVPSLIVGLWFHVYLVTRYGGTPGKLLLQIRIAMVGGASITTKAAALRYSVLFVLSMLASIALTIAVLSMSDQEYFSLGYIARSQRMVALAPAWYKTIVILTQIWVWGEFVTMLFNKKRRAVHDFLAGTVVVRSMKRT
ncbi:MAG TPA: RDD family protein [Rhodocyclaceae bacterium]|nr:RDD family protein [Rhodocyclaceae bacterium]